jgi:hypothetical protein
MKVKMCRKKKSVVAFPVSFFASTLIDRLSCKVAVNVLRPGAVGACETFYCRAKIKNLRKRNAKTLNISANCRHDRCYRLPFLSFVNVMKFLMSRVFQFCCTLLYCLSKCLSPQTRLFSLSAEVRLSLEGSPENSQGKLSVPSARL